MATIGFVAARLRMSRSVGRLRQNSGVCCLAPPLAAGRMSARENFSGCRRAYSGKRPAAVVVSEGAMIGAGSREIVRRTVRSLPSQPQVAFACSRCGVGMRSRDAEPDRLANRGDKTLAHRTITPLKTLRRFKQNQCHSFSGGFVRHSCLANNFSADRIPPGRLRREWREPAQTFCGVGQRISDADVRIDVDRR